MRQTGLLLRSGVEHWATARGRRVYSEPSLGVTVMGWRNANTMYASPTTDVPRTRAGRNVHRRAASRVGSSNGGVERITFASATPPPASTRTSTSTIPFSRARGGYNGITVARGKGVSFDGDATSLGGSPRVGVLSVGGRNMPTTSTFDSTGLRGFGSTGWPGSGSISPSAGWNCQLRTVLLMASVNGGVARSVLTALTTPLLPTVSSKNVSPPPMARIGIGGSAPSRYRAGTNPLCAASAATAPYTMIGH